MEWLLKTISLVLWRDNFEYKDFTKLYSVDSAMQLLALYAYLMLAQENANFLDRRFIGFEILTM